MPVGLLEEVFFNVILPRLDFMYPLQMLSEVVRSWPSLPLGATALDGAAVGLPLVIMCRMAASHVPVDIVCRAKTFGALAAGDGTVVGLLMPLLMLPAKRELGSAKSQETGERGMCT